MALPWFYSKRTDPSDTPWSTNEHLNTPQNIPKYSPRQPHHTSDNHWTSPRQSYNFWGTRESFRVSEGCLRSVWGLSEGCLEFFEDVWQCLLVSAGVCCCVRGSGVVFGCICVIFWDVGADWGCIRVYMWAQYGRDQVRTKPTHHLSTTLKGKIFFHLTLLRHQNIKTSLCKLSKNHWVMLYFVSFRSVREKLQFTVSLDHPVPYDSFHKTQSKIFCKGIIKTKRYSIYQEKMDKIEEGTKELIGRKSFSIP